MGARPSVNIIILISAVIALSAVICTEQAPAQMVREPSIEGVSYSEIAQWQMTYGRGPFFRGGYGPGFCSPPPNVIEYCEVDEPPVVIKKTSKKKSSAK